VAAGNVDVTPTVLALLGVGQAAGASGEGAVALDGRVLSEALEGGPDPERVTQETRVLTTEAGVYRAAIQLSEVDGRRYVDKSWRIS
jgi:hypothetical protein